MSLSDIMSKPDCTDKQCGLYRPTSQNLLIAVISQSLQPTPQYKLSAVKSHLYSCLQIDDSLYRSTPK